jgi:hypothetical protein
MLTSTTANKARLVPERFRDRILLCFDMIMYFQVVLPARKAGSTDAKEKM